MVEIQNEGNELWIRTSLPDFGQVLYFGHSTKIKLAEFEHDRDQDVNFQFALPLFQAGLQ